MKSKLCWFVASLIAVLGLGGPVRAITIDTTGSFSFNITPFGAPNTTTYGQTFIAPDSNLDSFSLYLQQRVTVGSATLDLRGYVATWNGSQVTTILYESTTQTMNANGTLQEFSFAPNLSLTVGQQYVAFLSISNLPAQPSVTFGMPTSGINLYPGGGFVASNGALLSASWSIFTTDVWFKASFNGVPGPIAGAGLPGLMLACGGLLAWYRRRQSATQIAA